MNPRVAAAIMQRRRRESVAAPLRELARTLFPEQRAFYEDHGKLVAALCGRRAGKTRGGCLAMLLAAATTQNGRFLYMTTTIAECRKLAWYGLRGDGMYSLAVAMKLDVVPNGSQLTLHFPALDSWIYMHGCDDEAGVRKALGLAYHEVWIDEAQGLPPKLEQPIRSVLMPTLLDYGGRLRLTGTPVRNMSGIFYSVTRGDSEALKRWSVHRWNLLANPFFGRVDQRGDSWSVISKDGREVSRYPLANFSDAIADAREERHRSGILELQELFGGPDAAPLDSPIMRREGFGEWVHEDALFVYDVHKVWCENLWYAFHRTTSQVIRVARAEGEKLVIEEVCFPDFPDLDRALHDLQGYPTTDYYFALAADIGYRDPFAFCLVAWSLKDPVLYEVACWGHSELDQPTQAAILRFICDKVNVGVVTADAGGSTLPTVKGWSREWQARYGIPIDEVEKTNKPGAVTAANGDITRLRMKFRQNGPLLRQLHQVQWLPTRTGTGRLLEDPSIPNDLTDSFLYAHRRSLAHRYVPEVPKPEPGTVEYYARIEQDMLDEFDVG